MNFRKGQRRAPPEINLIAFIDVLLVILIFLMVSTTFSKFSALNVSLPPGQGGTTPSPKSIMVVVDAQGHYAIQQQRVAASDPASLATVLRDAAHGNTEIEVQIHADAMASYQSVLMLMQAGRDAGLNNLTLMFNAQSGAAR
ncbi:ExbD Biopolymer transport protein [Oxalobacteraceae bacterium]